MGLKIIQIGVGGTGSQLAGNLCRFIKLMRSKGKDISLCFIDGDNYEMKNMANQNISINDIGKNKAEVLSDRYSVIYDFPISYKDSYIYSSEGLEDIIFGDYGYDDKFIIIGTVDNNSTRQVIYDIFNKIPNVIYIDSGNGTDNMKGQIVVGFRQRGELILPSVADVFPSILQDNDKIENIVGCDNYAANEAPQHIATNNMAATFLFSTLCNIIENTEIENHVIYFNANTCEVMCIKPSTQIKGVFTREGFKF